MAIETEKKVPAFLLRQTALGNAVDRCRVRRFKENLTVSHETLVWLSGGYADPEPAVGLVPRVVSGLAAGLKAEIV